MRLDLIFSQSRTFLVCFIIPTRLLFHYLSTRSPALTNVAAVKVHKEVTEGHKWTGVHLKTQIRDNSSKNH